MCVRLGISGGLHFKLHGFFLGPIFCLLFFCWTLEIRLPLVNPVCHRILLYRSVCGGAMVRCGGTGVGNLSRFNEKCLSADLCKRIFCSLVQFVCSSVAIAFAFAVVVVVCVPSRTLAIVDKITSIGVKMYNLWV